MTESLMESLRFFSDAIIVGTLIATTLSLYGVHLATRDSSLQCMVMSQAAQLGVLLTLGFISHENKTLPWFGGFLCALIISSLSGHIATKVRSSKNTVFIAFFLVLLASSYFVISVFPMLDSHHSQAFFGDLVYLAGRELQLAATVSSCALVLVFVQRKKWSNRSFLISTFGRDSRVGFKQDIIFSATYLALIVTSVFSVGLLLTLSALFIATTILSFSKKTSLRSHFLLCGIVTGTSVVIGFLATLRLGDFPTVPVIVLTLVFLSSFSYFLIDFLSRWSVGAK